MTTATLADWTTPQPFALPDLGPGLVDEQRQALELTLQAIAADGCWWCSPMQLRHTTHTPEVASRLISGGGHAESSDRIRDPRAAAAVG